MSHLLRSHAPITAEGWKDVDAEAVERLTPLLGARRVVDFAGPHGWQHSATNLGRTDSVGDGPAEGVRGRRRRVLPLAELQARFAVDREELRDGDRGADDVDYDDLDRAAAAIATAENAAVFHGWDAAGITGIVQATPHPPVPLGADPDAWTRKVAGAVEQLLRSGVGGPYALALDPARYTAVVETAEHGGYLLFGHLQRILGGPIVRTPGLRGAVVLSQRGGDFVLESGQDLSVGYLDHDAEAVRLYLEESFSFRVATPEAAVALPADN